MNSESLQILQVASVGVVKELETLESRMYAIQHMDAISDEVSLLQKKLLNLLD